MDTEVLLSAPRSSLDWANVSSGKRFLVQSGIGRAVAVLRKPYLTPWECERLCAVQGHSPCPWAATRAAATGALGSSGWMERLTYWWQIFGSLYLLLGSYVKLHRMLCLGDFPLRGCDLLSLSIPSFSPSQGL